MAGEQPIFYGMSLASNFSDRINNVQLVFGRAIAPRRSGRWSAKHMEPAIAVQNNGCSKFAEFCRTLKESIESLKVKLECTGVIGDRCYLIGDLYALLDAFESGTAHHILFSTNPPSEIKEALNECLKAPSRQL